MPTASRGFQEVEKKVRYVHIDWRYWILLLIKVCLQMFFKRWYIWQSPHPGGKRDPEEGTNEQRNSFHRKFFQATWGWTASLCNKDLSLRAGVYDEMSSQRSLPISSNFFFLLIGGDCRLLWDFLVQLLKNKTYMPYIRWGGPQGARVPDPGPGPDRKPLGPAEEPDQHDLREALEGAALLLQDGDPPEGAGTEANV